MAQTLSRTMDAAFLNGVANHCAVRPALGGKGPLDLSTLIANPANVAMQTEHGGFLVIKQEPGIYEVHTLFLPKGRGPELIDPVADGLRFMFAETDCIELQTKVPAGNSSAARLALVAGFQTQFIRDDAWMGLDGSLEPVAYQTLTFDRWKAQDAALVGLGRDFHDRLEDAKAAAGSTLEAHPDDEAHDRAVGASVLMFKAGNARKAVWLYNRWAKFAGYQTIELLDPNPVTVDVRDALIQVRNGEMEVLSCR